MKFRGGRCKALHVGTKTFLTLNVCCCGLNWPRPMEAGKDLVGVVGGKPGGNVGPAGGSVEKANVVMPW